MGKETESSTVVLKAEENVGMVQIADDVVAMIGSDGDSCERVWEGYQ